MSQRVKLPNGQIAEFPDQATPEQIKQALEQTFPQQKEQGGSNALTGVAKAFGIGIPKGIVGTVGMGGDLGHGAVRVGNWLASKASGVPAQTLNELSDQVHSVDQELAKPFMTPMGVNPGIGFVSPGSEQIQGMLERITGPWYQPQNTAEEYAQTAGAFLPAAASGGGNILQRGLRWLLPAATSETAGQAARKYWPDSEPYARFLGGLGGAGASIGADIAASTKLPGMGRFASGVMQETFRDNADLPQTLQKLGQEATLMDASHGGLGLAQGIVTKGGKSADDIVNMLSARKAAESDRLLADTNGAVGPYRDPVALKAEIDKTAQRAADPYYARAKNKAQPLPPGVEQTLSHDLTNSAEGMGLAQRTAYAKKYTEIEDALGAGDPKLVAERLHNLRKSYSDQIVWDERTFQGMSSADKVEQGAIKAARAAIDDVLKTHFPGFKTADAIISQAKKSQEAIDYGQKALHGGDNTVHPETFANDLKKQPLPMVQEGMKADIYTNMGTKSNDLSALRQRVGGSNDFNRAKMDTAFGPQATQKLVTAIDRERAFNLTNDFVANNSQTARRNEAAKMFDDNSKVPNLSSATTVGIPLQMSTKALKGLHSILVKSGSKNAMADIAKVMRLQGAERDQFVTLLLNRANAMKSVSERLGLPAVQSTQTAADSTQQGRNRYRKQIRR